MTGFVHESRVVKNGVGLGSADVELAQKGKKRSESRDDFGAQLAAAVDVGAEALQAAQAYQRRSSRQGDYQGRRTSLAAEAKRQGFETLTML